MRRPVWHRVGSVALSAALTCSFMVPTGALAATGESKGGSEEAAEKTKQAALEDAKAAGEDVVADEEVTIVVELETQSPSMRKGFSLFDLFAPSGNHEVYKDQIEEMIGDAARGASNADDEGLKAEQGEDSGKDDAEQESAQSAQTFDYSNVINGFSIRAPRSLLEDIQSIRGVKNAFVSEAHAAPLDLGDTSPLKNKDSLTMTGANQTAYSGKGQVIAIVDTGLRTDHEAFKGDLEDDSLALSEDRVNTIKSSLGEGKEGVYVSEKIPFAYDYAMDDNDVSDGNGHGTHVAGIAGANAGEVRGTAPEAQLLAMKVSTDQGSILDDALLAALDDAAKFDVDAVNVSIGADGGFSGDAQDTMANAVDKLEETGAVVNVAGGNSYSSAQGNLSGKGLPYATDPDSGTISSPASADAATAVASANNELGAPYFTTTYGDSIKWQGAILQKDNSAWPTLDVVTDGEYEVVDLGAVATWVWDDYSGKILLIERGGETPRGSIATFGDKLRYAAPSKAAAIIMYDNVESDVPMNMLLDEWAEMAETQIPTVSITKADGTKLKELQEKGGKVVLKAGQVTEPSKDYGVNDFSSWGATPDLSLKPDVTAPGGNIYSTTNDGKYGYMSGTSMATPQMTGISAQIAEYVKTDAKFAHMDDAAKKDAITQLLMSTAKPLVDPAVEGGYFSPRQQGAGIANVPAALATKVYATVDGAKSAAHPKAELGESAEGTWRFTVTLHNLGDTAATYSLDAVALSDQIKDGLFQQHSANYAGKGIDVAFGGAAQDGKVTVAANSTASYTVSITCQNAFKEAVAAATKGTFVDGFALLNGEDGATDLSVPFMGFYGDWGAASIFDGKLGTEEAHLWGSYLSSEGIGNSGGPLGFNPLDTESVFKYNNKTYTDRSEVMKAYHPDRLVVSNSADGYAPHTVTANTFLIRGASDFMWGFSKKDTDEGIQAYSRAYLKKSRQNTSTSGDPILSAETIANGYAQFGFDGQDEGWYQVSEYAAVAGDDAEQELVYDVYYDKTAPVVSNVVNTEDDDAAVKFTVTDSTWLAGVSVQTNPVYTVSTTESIKNYLADDLEATESIDEDGNRVYNVKIPIASLKEAWNAGHDSADMPNTLSLVAWDWGMNPSKPFTAVLNPVPATGATLSGSSVSMAPGQHKTLEVTLAPDDTTDALVDWTSSDENVVTVDANGTLTGVAAGEAKVTATVHGREVSATASVTVKDLNAKTGVLLSDDIVRVQNNGGAFDISAILSPSLSGRVVNWSSSDESIFTVEPSAVNPNAATVTGGYQVGTAQVSATIADGGRLYSASAMVRNWPQDYEDFVIEDGKLIAYKGSSLTVELPNDVKVIGESVFEDKRATEIRIPASVGLIEKAAFKNTSASQVVFEDTAEHPSCLTEVGEQAFANTSAGQMAWSSFRFPESVKTLGEGVMEGKSCSRIYVPASVTVIPDNAFTGTHDEIYIGDDVTSIGAHAFSAGNPQAMMFGTLYIIGREAEQMVNVDGGSYAKDSLLPSKLESIGVGAFQGTNAFAELTLPNGVKSIGDSAFATMSQSIHNNGGPALVVNFNEGLESIGASAFEGTRIETLVLPDTVKSVGSRAFSSIGILESFTVGKDVDASDLEGAFVYSDSIKGFKVADGCKNYTVDEQGILYSKDMSTLVAYPMGAEPADVVIPEGVKTIASGAFDAYDGGFLDFCSNAPKTVTFPDSLETIEEHALNTYLEVVDLGANVKKIATNAFGDTYGHTDLNPASPAHLVVRGGTDYTVSYTDNVDYYHTSYFGPGVKSIDFSGEGFRTSDLMVVNSDTLDEFKYTTNWWPSWYADPVAIYAKKGTEAYDTIKTALKNGTIDFGYYYDGWCADDEDNESLYEGKRKAILHDYEQLGAFIECEDIVKPGTAVGVKAVVRGGVGSKQVRWFTVGADGTRTYLSDSWTSDKSFTWHVPEGENESLRVEVRDASYLTVEGTMAAEPLWTQQPNALKVGQNMSGKLTAKAEVSNGELSYQWFKATKKDMSNATAWGKATTAAEDGTASVDVDSSKMGTFYYAVKATNTVPQFDVSEDSMSDIAAVEVVSAAEGELLVSKAELDAAADKAAKVEKGDKSDDAYAALQKAVAAAKEAAGNPNATKAEVEAASKELENALDTFKDAPTQEQAEAQKKFDEAVVAAEQVDASKLTDAEKATLAAAVAAAKAVAGQEGVTAQHLNEAASKLAAAVKTAQTAADKAAAEKTAAEKAAALAKASTINTATVSAAQVKKASDLGATTVTLGAKVKKIAPNAFKGTKVKTLVVKTTKLNKKKVKNSLKGSSVTTVKVQVKDLKATKGLKGKKLKTAKKANKKAKATNKKYVKKYKKIFTKKVAGKKVKVK